MLLFFKTEMMSVTVIKNIFGRQKLFLIIKNVIFQNFDNNTLSILFYDIFKNKDKYKIDFKICNSVFNKKKILKLPADGGFTLISAW